MNERRTTTRMRVLKSAWIVVGPKAPKIACAIRNRSDTGACLQVHSGTFGVPNAFELMIGEPGSRHACQVVWRTEGRLGVRFG